MVRGSKAIMEVTIILPYFNASKYIDQTVDSIIAQTYKDWELIIIDDCSTEMDTEKILKKILAKDNRIKLFNTEKNSGAGVARNLGMEKASGRFIAFCDSDDWWYPDKLAEQIQFMKNNEYEFTCTYYEDTDEKLVPYYIMRQPEKQTFKKMIAGCNLGTPGCIYDTQRIGKKFMPALRRAEDWGLWLTILKEVDFVYSYPKVLWKYRHVSGSETSNKWKMLFSVSEMYRVVLNYSLLKAWFVVIFVFLPNNILKKVKKGILNFKC